MKMSAKLSPHRCKFDHSLFHSCNTYRPPLVPLGGPPVANFSSIKRTLF